MRTRLGMLILTAALLSSTQSSASAVKLADFIDVIGRVTTAAHPVENALVIALDLSNFTAIQTFTGSHGEFRLPRLRSGVYRIIAVKNGFAPTAATVLPVRQNHDLDLKLTSDSGSTSKNDEIWSIRNSLPSDVLRELRSVVDPPPPPAVGTVDQESMKFQTQMVSMTGVDPASATASWARTAVGVRGDLGRGWKVDFEGKLNRFDDDSGEATAFNPIAESSGVSMELRSQPGDVYRIASTHSSWKYQSGLDGDPSAADLESHNIEWGRPGSKVQVRYIAEENLFRSQSGSELFEVTGEKTLYGGKSSKLGVEVRLAQETLAGSRLAVPYRRADIVTSGAYDTGSALVFHYGLHSRVSETGTEWAPQTAAELKIGHAAVIVSGLYKVHQDEDAGPVPTSLVLWNQPGSESPRYSYSVTFLAGDEDRGRLKAVASVTAVDAGMRLVFDDQFAQLWETFYLLPGDIRQDVSVSFHRKLGRTFVMNLMTSAGSAIGSKSDASERTYINSSLQSLYKPTGTSLDLTYRQIDQKPIEAPGSLSTERLNIQMGQSLRLPLDLRLLVGMELARSIDSRRLALSNNADLQTRYLGGIALAF